MKNEILEIEKYEVIEPNEDSISEQVEYLGAETVVCKNIDGASCTIILRIYFKANQSEKKSYKITKQFANLLENKTIYTLVAGPLNGFFVLKVTHTDGSFFFQIVNLLGKVVETNIKTIGAAYNFIHERILKKFMQTNVKKYQDYEL